MLPIVLELVLDVVKDLRFHSPGSPQAPSRSRKYEQEKSDRSRKSEVKARSGYALLLYLFKSQRDNQEEDKHNREEDGWCLQYRGSLFLRHAWFPIEATWKVSAWPHTEQ